MGIKGAAAKALAAVFARDIKRWSSHPLQTQEAQFRNLLSQSRETAFAREHGLARVKSYEDFKKQVPIRDYEGLRPFIDRIIEGERDVLWPGRPIYFAKTSGTTSGVKYIPITKDSISNHIDSARNALLMYALKTGNSSFFDGKMIFLSGSPVLGETGGIKTGRLSGIVNHHVPQVLKGNQMPGYETNCIEDWEQKLDRIVEETMKEDMRLISGIPPWMQMYFDRLQERTGKKVGELFPNLQLLVHGGVNFQPYRERMMESMGRETDTIETFPASEGFIAFQDSLDEKGLLLILNKGIFFEFIPAEESGKENPERVTIRDVELNKNYALILNTNAGLWGYDIGDTVKFTSKDPYRLVVSGRTKHFISAFGEHVIAEEVESVLAEAAREMGALVNEFTVAPQITPPDESSPYHEWFIEFEKEPENLLDFRLLLDNKLRQKNIYYDDLVRGHILQPLMIRRVQRQGFSQYMASLGRLGGQNKPPRLGNDRSFAKGLENWLENEK
ncbi:MAG: GH3 auxin-responsive promoter family protein [Bacteroidia bacterium]